MTAAALFTLVLCCGCLRTAYPHALLASQEACAQLYRDCGSSALAGAPCRSLPRCPMRATIDTSVSGTWRDLAIWPFYANYRKQP
jgi:hypothetical protein